MKIKILLLLLFTEAILPQNKVQLEPKGEYAKIDTTKERLIRFQLTSKYPEVRKAAIARVLTKPNQYSPPILYLLSSVLFRENRKAEAVRWFYTGQLRARYDANRCADETARQAVAQLNQLFGPDINKYAFADKTLLKKEVLSAISFVSENPEEYDQRWINLHGMGAFTATDAPGKPLSMPQADWPEIMKKTIADYKAGFEEAYEQIP